MINDYEYEAIRTQHEIDRIDREAKAFWGKDFRPKKPWEKHYASRFHYFFWKIIAHLFIIKAMYLTFKNPTSAIWLMAASVIANQGMQNSRTEWLIMPYMLFMDSANLDVKFSVLLLGCFFTRIRPKANLVNLIDILMWFALIDWINPELGEHNSLLTKWCFLIFTFDFSVIYTFMFIFFFLVDLGVLAAEPVAAQPGKSIFLVVTAGLIAVIVSAVLRIFPDAIEFMNVFNEWFPLENLKTFAKEKKDEDTVIFADAADNTETFRRHSFDGMPSYVEYAARRRKPIRKLEADEDYVYNGLTEEEMWFNCIDDVRPASKRSQRKSNRAKYDEAYMKFLNVMAFVNVFGTVTFLISAVKAYDTQVTRLVMQGRILGWWDQRWMMFRQSAARSQRFVRNIGHEVNLGFFRLAYAAGIIPRRTIANVGIDVNDLPFLRMAVPAFLKEVNVKMSFNPLNSLHWELLAHPITDVLGFCSRWAYLSIAGKMDKATYVMCAFDFSSLAARICQFLGPRARQLFWESLRLAFPNAERFLEADIGEDEDSLSYIAKILRALRKWTEVSRETKRVATYFLAVVSTVPLLMGATVDKEVWEKRITYVGNILETSATTEKLVDSVLALSVKTMELLGFGSLGAFIATLMHDQTTEILYTNAEEVMHSFARGEERHFGRVHHVLEKAKDGFKALQKKRDKYCVHATNRLTSINDMIELIRAKQKMADSKMRAVVALFVGDSQIGKTTLCKALIDHMSHRIQVEPTTGMITREEYDDTLSAAQNFAIFDDMGSSSEKMNKESDGDRLMRLANSANVPLVMSAVTDKGVCFGNHLAILGTANSWAAGLTNVNDAAAHNRIDIPLRCIPDETMGEMVEDKWLPLDRASRAKPIPNHLLFTFMKRDRSNDKEARIVGGAQYRPDPRYKQNLTWEEFLPLFLTRFEAAYRENERTFNKSNAPAEICEHSQYRIDCPHCNEEVQRHTENAIVPVVRMYAGMRGFDMYWGFVLNTGLWRFSACELRTWRLLFTVPGIAILLYACLARLGYFLPDYFIMTAVLMFSLRLFLIPYRSVSRVSQDVWQQLLSGVTSSNAMLGGASIAALAFGIKVLRNKFKQNMRSLENGVPESTIGGPIESVESAKKRFKQEAADESGGIPWVKPIFRDAVGSTSGSGADLRSVINVGRTHQWTIRATGLKCEVTYLAPGAILMNRHTWNKLPEGLVCFTRKTDKGTIEKHINIDKLDVYVHEKKDFVVLSIPMTLGSNRGLVDWFAPEFFNDTRDGVLLSPRTDVSLLCSGKTRDETFQCTTYSDVSCAFMKPASEPGWSGSLYIDVSTKSFIGIHTGGTGTADDRCWFTRITAGELIVALKSLKHNQYVPKFRDIKWDYECGHNSKGFDHPKGVHRHCTGNAIVEVLGHAARVGAGKSTYVPNPYGPEILERLGVENPPKYIPPNLRKYNHMAQPVLNMSTGQRGFIPRDLVKSVVDEMQVEAAQTLDDYLTNPYAITTPLSLQQALNGIHGHPHINGIKMNTGAGLPIGGKKHAHIDLLPDGTRQLNDKAQRDFNDLYGRLIHGFTTGAVSNAIGKDEPRPADKENAEIPRCFMVDNFLFLLLCKKYLEPICAWMMTYPVEFCHAIGVDPMGMNWHNIMKHYLVCQHGEFFGADASKYDWHHCPELNDGLVQDFMGCAKQLGYDKVGVRIVGALVWECCSRPVNFNGPIVDNNYSWNSGTLITALGGARKTNIIIRSSFKSRHPNKNFVDYILLNALGDDSLTGKKKPINWGAPEIVTDGSKYGLFYTNDAKTGEPEKDDFENVMYLKRKTVFNEELGYLVGRLDINSVMRPLILWEDTDSPSSKLNDVMSGILRELVAHGRVMYTNWQAVFMEFLNEKEIPAHDNIKFTYLEMVASIKNHGHNRDHNSRRFLEAGDEDGGVGALSGETETHEQVHFETPSLETAPADSGIDSTIKAYTQDRHQVPNFVKREVNLPLESLGVGVAVMNEYYPLRNLIGEESILERVSHFHAASFKLGMRVAISASRFHCGRFRMSILYNPTELDKWNEMNQSRFFFNVWSSCRHHVDFDIGIDGGAEIEIPFFWHQGAMPLTSANIQNYVRVYIHSITPVQSASAVDDDPEMRVYVRFIEFEALGTSAKKFQGGGGKNPEEKLPTKPSVIASKISSAAEFASAFPPFKVPAELVAMGAGLGSDMLRMFGMSRPIDSSISSQMRHHTTPLANANSDVLGRTLAFDHKQGVALGGYGSGPVDEMSYQYLSEIPNIIVVGSLTNATASNVNFRREFVTPMKWEFVDEDLVLTTAGMVAAQNYFWHGTVCFRLHVVAPTITGGRINAFWDAGDGIDVAHTYNDVYTMDLKTSRSLTIKVDMMMADNFLITNKVFTGAKPGLFDPEMHNGTVSFQIEGKITGLTDDMAVYYYIEHWVEDAIYACPSYHALSPFRIRDEAIEEEEEEPEVRRLQEDVAVMDRTSYITKARQQTIANGLTNFNPRIWDTATTDNDPATSAPTPGLGGEELTSAPTPVPTNAFTSAPTPAHSSLRPSRLPTRQPSTDSPTPVPTAAATNSPTAPQAAYYKIKPPSIFWGTCNSCDIVDDTTVKQHSRFMIFAPCSYGPNEMEFTPWLKPIPKLLSTLKANSFNFGYINAGLCICVRSDTEFRWRFGADMTEKWSFNDVELWFPTGYAPIVLTIAEVRTKLINDRLGGTNPFDIVPYNGFQTIIFNKGDVFSMQIPRVDGEAFNSVAVELSGIWKAFPETSTSNTVDTPDRRFAYVFESLTDTFRLEALVDGCKVYSVGYLVKDNRRLENDENEALFHIKGPPADHSALMKAHVGEWHHSLRTHLKIPQYRRHTYRMTTGDTILERYMYMYTNDPTPMDIMYHMYGAMRGGIESTFEVSRGNGSLRVFRGSNYFDVDRFNDNLRGFELLDTTTNRALTVHFPYMSRFRFLYTRGSPLLTEDNVIAAEFDSLDNGSTTEIVFEHVSVAEDFHAFYLIGCPLMRRPETTP